MILVTNWNFPLCYALPICGCCTNKNEFNSLEFIHCRAARVIYNLPHDMPSEDVRKTANWDSLFDTYKVKIATLIANEPSERRRSDGEAAAE